MDLNERQAEGVEVTSVEGLVVYPRVSNVVLIRSLMPTSKWRL